MRIITPIMVVITLLLCSCAAIPQATSFSSRAAAETIGGRDFVPDRAVQQAPGSDTWPEWTIAEIEIDGEPEVHLINAVWAAEQQETIEAAFISVAAMARIIRRGYQDYIDSLEAQVAELEGRLESGDLNGDGKTGVGDLLLLLAAWGDGPAPTPEALEEAMKVLQP